MTEGSPGRVVLLNGTSSSGKSTIGRQLLVDFETPWFHMGVDMFGAMRAERRTHELEPAGLRTVLHRTRAGFHRAVAGMAQAGNDIVMDHVLSEPWRLNDLLAVMTGVDVIFVGVHCSAADLGQREASRSDRASGTAVSQAAMVHVHGRYDVEVDTSASSAETCSTQIRDYLRENPGPVNRAFDDLRRGQSSQPNSTS
ncbi:chloramphenicol phosphotransferase [Mycolicibacterium sp. P1-18]|uniref:chloramphenicol phosphotransferase CPT family protein n=1 Tax=Mycolicibacterium sp. P1-18 TaxID=2024615 RepID=UPI0011F1A2FA|nr:AAA family ATPase [Mycolicibacterium sp. P1-18]KAA0099790.1 chloramphenicol phosphotransferase [Mycolicibacterium sp. P1-18]